MYPFVLDWHTVFYEENSLSAMEMAHAEAYRSLYIFSSQVSHLPLGSIGLPHLPLNPSQMKAPDGAI